MPTLPVPSSLLSSSGSCRLCFMHYPLFLAHFPSNSTLALSSTWATYQYSCLSNTHLLSHGCFFLPSCPLELTMAWHRSNSTLPDFRLCSISADHVLWTPHQLTASHFPTHREKGSSKSVRTEAAKFPRGGSEVTSYVWHFVGKASHESKPDSRGIKKNPPVDGRSDQVPVQRNVPIRMTAIVVTILAIYLNTISWSNVFKIIKWIGQNYKANQLQSNLIIKLFKRTTFLIW